MLVAAFWTGSHIHILLLSLPSLWKGTTVCEERNSWGALIVLQLLILPGFAVSGLQGEVRHFPNWERSAWNGRTSS
jgi:hypothetical protein